MTNRRKRRLKSFKADREKIIAATTRPLKILQFTEKRSYVYRRRQGCAGQSNT